ncbi:MAG TPA: pitrilysin family protein [Gemmatimonadales bacterium]|nr:pitrilysin family protein [Gemmatimonadales bacterium]
MTTPTQTVQLDTGLYRTTCPNGLVVLTERLPGVRSVATGVWMRSANAHESPEVMGVSHLLEHMVFKGTARRTAHEIALALESRGGSLDAYTSRDHTAFQAHVLDEDLPLALDVLTDLVRNPLLRDSDLQLERNVVLEEINGVTDTPDDLVHELFGAALYPDHPYGRPILGTAETVSALSVEDLQATHSRGYYPGNAVIAAAGNLEHEDYLEQIDRLGWLVGDGADALAPASAPTGDRGRHIEAPRELQQVHIVMGTDTFPAADPRRWAMSLVSATLGGGMSSRLFQRVREEKGLCYAIYCWHAMYRSGGNFALYVGTAPATADQAVATINEELARVAAEGLSAGDLADAKGQLKGTIMLALEGTTARMSRLASHALMQEPYRPLDEILRLIDAVTMEDTAQVAGAFLTPERMTTVRLGPSR